MVFASFTNIKIISPKINTLEGIAFLAGTLAIVLNIIGYSSGQVASVPQTFDPVPRLASIARTMSPVSELADVSGAGSGLLDSWTFNGATPQASGGLAFPSSNAFSYSFWIKTTSTAYSEIIDWQYQRECAINYSGTNKIYCTMDGTLYDGTASLSNINDGNWHHVVYTATASNQSLYVDNVLQVTNSVTSLGTNGGSISVGSEIGGGSPLTGSLEDVRIYDHALGTSDIAALYALDASLTASNSASSGSSGTTNNTSSNTSTGNNQTSGGQNQGQNQNTQSSSSSQYAAPAIQGNNIYISQSSAGTGSGADCADAAPVSWLNLASSWAPTGTAANSGSHAQLGPGDKVDLCPGIISSGFSILGSGAAGNPITIYFMPGAVMSAPYWTGQPYNAAISIPIAISWVTIDGGTNGVIESTANGTALANQKTANYGIQVVQVNADHFTVQNLTIRGMYVRTPGSMDETQAGIGIEASGNYITLQNNTITDAMYLIHFSYGVYQNLVIRNNTLTRADWGIALGASGSAGAGQAAPDLDGVTLAGNRIDGLDVWQTQNDSSGNYIDVGFHRNGIMIYNEYLDASGNHAGVIADVNIYGNHIGPGVLPSQSPGVNAVSNAGTAAIFFDLYTANQVRNAKVYDNVLELRSPLSWGDGFIFVGGNAVIANNTVIGHGASQGIYANYGSLIRNNLTYNISYPIEVREAPGLTATNVDSDYNEFYYNGISSVGVGYFSLISGPTGFYTTLAAWQTATRADMDSLMAEPQLVNVAGGDYHLTAGSPAVGAGVNLSDYSPTVNCSSMPGLCTDYDGKARPSTGPWDIGAYQYSSAAISTTPPPNSTTAPIPPAPPVPPAVPPADTTPPALSSIAASSVTTQSALISWSTNEAATGQIQYGLTASYGNLTSLASALTTSHAQSLTGLQPGTLYHYRVISADAAGNTQPSSDGTFDTLSITPNIIQPPVNIPPPDTIVPAVPQTPVTYLPMRPAQPSSPLAPASPTGSATHYSQPKPTTYVPSQSAPTIPVPADEGPLPAFQPFSISQYISDETHNFWSSFVEQSEIIYERVLKGVGKLSGL